jgi:hypothetical protein
MRIASAATALPKHRYDQQAILDALKFHASWDCLR